MNVWAVDVFEALKPLDKHILNSRFIEHVALRSQVLRVEISGRKRIGIGCHVLFDTNIFKIWIYIY